MSVAGSSRRSHCGEPTDDSDGDDRLSPPFRYAYPNMRKDTVALLKTLADRWDVAPGHLHAIFDQTTTHQFWANVDAFNQKRPHLSLPETLVCLRVSRAHNPVRQKRNNVHQQGWWPSDVTTAEDLTPIQNAPTSFSGSRLGDRRECDNENGGDKDGDNEDEDNAQDAPSNSGHHVDSDDVDGGDASSEDIKGDDSSSDDTSSDDAGSDGASSDDANSDDASSENVDDDGVHNENVNDVNDDNSLHTSKPVDDDVPLGNDDDGHAIALQQQLHIENQRLENALNGSKEKENNDRDPAFAQESPPKRRRSVDADTEIFSTPLERPSKRRKMETSNEEGEVNDHTATPLSLSRDRITSVLTTIASLRPDKFQVTPRLDQPADAQNANTTLSRQDGNAAPAPTPIFLAPIHLRDDHWALATLNLDTWHATVYDWKPALRGLIPEPLQAACAGLTLDRPLAYTYDAKPRVVTGRRVDGGVPVVAAVCFLVSHGAVPAVLDGPL